MSSSASSCGSCGSCGSPSHSNSSHLIEQSNTGTGAEDEWTDISGEVSSLLYDHKQLLAIERLLLDTLELWSHSIHDAADEQDSDSAFFHSFESAFHQISNSFAGASGSALRVLVALFDHLGAKRFLECCIELLHANMYSHLLSWAFQYVKEDAHRLAQIFTAFDKHNSLFTSQSLTRGHVVVSQSDRERAQRAKSDLLYGEVLPAGILRMMDSEHLQAEKASVLLDLGSGCGKLCVQTFHQYSNLQRVIGVELSEERVKLAMNALDRLEKLYAERASVKLSFANGIVSKGSLTLMNDWTTTTVPSLLNSDKRKTLPMSEEKDEMKTDEKTALCSSMEIEQKIVDHSCGNDHQDNMDEKSSYALSHDSYQRRAPYNVLPTSRSLEFIVDDLFNFACEVNLADIVIAETKFEESRFEDICLMLSKMKPGARLLTYDSLPEMFLLSGLANKVIFPFTFIRNLPESMDRFEASWSPVNGHRFHLYRKLHPAELTECVLEEQRRMFEDHVQQMEQDKKARCMRQQMDAKSKAMAMAMDAQNSHNANPQHQHQHQQQQQQHAVPPTQSVFRSRVVATAERSANANQYADNSNYRSARVSVAEGSASENSVSMSVSPTPAGTPSTSASFSSNSPPFSPASSPPVSHSPGVGLPSSSSLAQLQTTFDVMNRLTNSLVRMMEKSRKELSNTGNGIGLGIGIDSGKVHEEGVERIESEEHAYEQIDDDEDDEEDEDDDEEVEGDAEAGAEGGTQARR